jgi:hypothetical protein
MAYRMLDTDDDTLTPIAIAKLFSSLYPPTLARIEAALPAQVPAP